MHDHRRVGPGLLEQGARLGQLVGLRSERRELHLVGGDVLRERLDPAADRSGRPGRRLAPEDERDGIGILVGHDAARQQEVDEVGGLRGAPDLPLGRAAAALAQVPMHLGHHLVDLGRVEPLPLEGVPARPTAHAEGVAGCLDALAVGRERTERVGVLGDLAQHPPTPSPGPGRPTGRG